MIKLGKKEILVIARGYNVELEVIENIKRASMQVMIMESGTRNGKQFLSFMQL